MQLSWPQGLFSLLTTPLHFLSLSPGPTCLSTSKSPKSRRAQLTEAVLLRPASEFLTLVPCQFLEGLVGENHLVSADSTAQLPTG